MTARVYTPEQRERKRATNAAWAAANPEKRRAATAAWLAAHPEKRRAIKTAWAARNPEKVRATNRASSAAYRAANLERRRAATAAWAAANPERARASVAAWAAANPARHRATTAAWEAANPEKVRELAHRKRVRRSGAGTCDHAGCLALGPVQFAWQTNEHRCYLCGIPVFMGRGGNLHMDHVTPLIRGGLHCAENIRPSCAPCNLRKGARAAVATLAVTRP